MNLLKSDFKLRCDHPSPFRDERLHQFCCKVARSLVGLYSHWRIFSWFCIFKHLWWVTIANGAEVFSAFLAIHVETHGAPGISMTGRFQSARHLSLHRSFSERWAATFFTMLQWDSLFQPVRSFKDIFLNSSYIFRLDSFHLAFCESLKCAFNL